MDAATGAGEKKQFLFRGRKGGADKHGTNHFVGCLMRSFDRCCLFRTTPGDVALRLDTKENMPWANSLTGGEIAVGANAAWRCWWVKKPVQMTNKRWVSTLGHCGTSFFVDEIHM